MATPVALADATDADRAASTITVTATRAPISLFESPVTVTVIDREEMDETLVEDIRDLVRFEPGVSVRRRPARFGAALSSTGRDGNAGFNIRGLDGNRVLLQVDGIRVPDAFSFGAQLTGRDSVDLGLVKSVEILRGPASSLYGSDGLGGAVSFQTADPEDLLGPSRTLAGALRSAFDSADTSAIVTASAAARTGRLSMLAGYTFRKGEELRNQGDNKAENASRTAPNPQDRRVDSVLGKLVFDAAPGQRFRLTGELYRATTKTEVLSGRSVNPLPSTAVIDLDALDRVSRSRLSLDWTITGAGALEEAFLTGYWQQGRDRQQTFEDRATAPDRIRDNSFDSAIYGVAGNARLGIETGPFAHRLVFGGEWYRTRQEGLRDGTVPTPPDVYPTRAFPPTDFTLGGLYVADEIRLFDDRLILFPGLRFDTYSLVPEPDPLTPGGAVAGNRNSALSPKFGATLKLSDGLNLVASYARGFRAPAPSQVNQFFDNPTSPFFAYRSIPNPDLGPERSDAIEGGIRFDRGPVSGQLTAFAGWYDDFISQEVVGGRGTIADPVVFQFINLQSVRIHGLEGRATVALGEGFTLNGAFAWARGRVIAPDGARTGLISIDPLELVGGLRWRARDDRFGAELVGTAALAKERQETEGLCTPACLLSGNWATLDILAHWRLNERLTLRAGLFNLTNATYVEWSTIRGLADTAANRSVRDAFTSPPRNVTVSLSARF
jgi:hemoglobin/transferrin/lactoferrin receptor protein